MIAPRIEVSIKENLEKYVSQTTRTIIGESFKDNFNGNLVPTFDRSCHELFLQLTENLVKSFQKQQNLMTSQIQRDPEAITFAPPLLEIAEKLTGTIINAQSALRLYSEQVGEEIDEQVMINKPIDRSRVQQMINDRNFEAAFLAVIAERDINLISWLVDILEPESRIKLNQSVIISVIQQLTCCETLEENKLNWILFCLKELNPKDEAIRDYVIDVLHNLKFKINNISKIIDPKIHKEIIQIIEIKSSPNC